MHLKNKDSLTLNLLVGGNSPDAKPAGVLALRLDTSPFGYSVRPLAAFKVESC